MIQTTLWLLCSHLKLSIESMTKVLKKTFPGFWWSFSTSCCLPRKIPTLIFINLPLYQLPGSQGGVTMEKAGPTLDELPAHPRALCAHLGMCKLDQQYVSSALKMFWHFPLLPEHPTYFDHAGAWTENQYCSALSPTDWATPATLFATILKLEHFYYRLEFTHFYDQLFYFIFTWSLKFHYGG